MLHDFRYAIRALRRAPLFTATALLTLILGIGATTVIFSVVSAQLLRPLPFDDPSRLVQVAEKNDRLGLPVFGSSVLNYLSWTEAARSFDAMGAVGAGNFALAGDRDTEQIAGATITPSLVPLLGIRLVSGRSFQTGDDAPGAPPVVLVSERMWRTRFGSDPELIGRFLRINGVPTQVIGVAPQALTTLTAAEMWAPLTIDRAKERRLQHVITVFARLRPGVSAAQALTDMEGVSRHMIEQFPELKDWSVTIVSLRDTFVSPQLRTALLVLLAAVACVLLIASANVASLLLARATVRQHEVIVRTALGATQAHVVRLLLVESLVLAGLGGTGGVLAAMGALRGINAILPPALLPIPNISLDLTVLLVTIGATVGVGLLFGLAPAWHLSRPRLASGLSAARSSVGAGRPWLRSVLVAAELALATMLLVGAALLGQSMMRLERVPLGFDADRLLTFQVAPSASKYPSQAASVALYQAVLPALAGISGVESAAASSAVPFGNGGYTRTPVTPIGASALPPDTPVPIDWRAVSPGFFKTMGIPVLSGRTFTTADGVADPPVMIVSASMARTFWGDENPIGRTVRRVADQRQFTVIGIVGDVRNINLNQELPTMYYSSDYRVWPTMDLALKVSGSTGAIATAARERLKAIDPDLPMSFVRTMDEWVSANAAQPRLNAIVLLAFAIAALIIAAVGIYGMLAYTVSQRTREIGLRMALGAERQSVLGLIVREGMTVGLIGIGAGLAGALALTRALRALLFGVSTTDPVTFAGVAVLLALVALLACVIPARRAASVDPMTALRRD